MDAIPSIGPFVGEAPEDRHALRVVGEMLTCLDDFAATVQPRLDAAMGSRIPGSIKGRERFLARLKAVPTRRSSMSLGRSASAADSKFC
jgi:hypothetical protein